MTTPFSSRSRIRPLGQVWEELNVDWLTFSGARYALFQEGTQIRVARHATIGTRLYPRWYCRPLEPWGVTSEHVFEFSNLQRWAQTP